MVSFPKKQKFKNRVRKIKKFQIAKLNLGYKITSVTLEN